MRSQERLQLVAGGKGMLLDTALLTEMRDGGEIMKYKSPHLLELDVTHLQPETVASIIVAHTMSVRKSQGESIEKDMED
jgi:hypothetical protein